MEEAPPTTTSNNGDLAPESFDEVDVLDDDHAKDPLSSSAAGHGLFSGRDQAINKVVQARDDDDDDSSSAAPAFAAAGDGSIVESARGAEAGEGHVAAAAATVKQVSLWRMLSGADKWDVLLMTAGWLGALCLGLVQPAFFVLFGKMINASESNADNPKSLAAELAKLAFSMFAISTTVIISAWAESTCWMYTAERQVCKLRSKFLKAVIYQNVEFFNTQSKTAQIIGIMSSDIATIQEVIGFKMGKFVRFMTTFVAGICVGLYYCWQLALLTIATVPITAVLVGTYNKAGVKIAAKVQDAMAQSADVIEETTSRIRTVYSYTSEMRQTQKFTDALAEKSRLGEKGGLVKGIGIGALVATVNLSWALLLWFGGILITKHETQAGYIITATFSIVYAGQALGTVTQCLQSFAEGKTSAAKVLLLIDKKPLILNIDEGIKPNSITGAIMLRTVSFRYESRPDVLVLRDVSLEIPAGNIFALVGGSGSGKSTIISLIERYYDPEKGGIFLDGFNLKDLNLRWLRTQIGLVGQEPVLFAASIIENLMYGKKDATMTEIEAASKAANAHSFILQLPEGYHTQVGEGGVRLSGGQRQRLAIVRAILKNPSILLLDEATSALDTQSERLVQEALDGFMQSRTTLVVAHRLSTIHNADTIVVLQKGQVIETGSHDTLMKLGPNGAYYSFLRSQALGTDEREKQLLGLNTKHEGRSPRLYESTQSIEHRRIPHSIHSTSLSFSPSILGTPISPQISTPSHDDLSVGNKVEINTKMEKAEWENPGITEAMLAALRRLSSSKRKETSLGIIGAIFSGAAMPIFLFFLFDVCIAYIDADQSRRDKKIQRILLLLVFLAIVSFLSNLLQHLNFAKASEFLMTDILGKMFKGKNQKKPVEEQATSRQAICKSLNNREIEDEVALLQKKVSWYDQEQNTSGALTESFLEKVVPMNSVVTEFASTILRTSSTFCVCVGLAFIASWPMALLILAILPVVTFGTLQRSNDVKCVHSGEMRKACDNANMIAGEAVNNIRTVASFTAEEKMLARFQESLQTPFRSNSERSVRIGLMIAIGHSAVLFSICLILYVSALLVGAKKASFLRCLQASQILSYTAESLGEAISMSPIIESARQAFQMAVSVIGQKMTEQTDDGADHGLETTQGRIEFANVSFAYPSRPSVLVLRDFNLEVPAGKTVAIVGRSGSGKSSVLALLQRFYEPQTGHIRLDGTDISELGFQWLRRQMAVVQQEPALFTATVEENIRYGREDATEAELREAARISNADAFVSSLPEGYKTHVGNKGVQLSGGQRQRIAIARAVLRKPKVLLLDEATSALDSKSEAIVQGALERVADHTCATVLVVAHRVSTIRSAHVIAVLEQGRVKELGSHDQLMQRPSGLYAQLFRLQGQR